MEKEHPILFSTDMVKAILEGRKTMTRRVAKYQPVQNEFSKEWMFPAPKNSNADYAWATNLNNSSLFKSLCPYGKVGDVLWVRENFEVQQVNRIFDECWMNHICLDFIASKETLDARHWFWMKESETPKVIRRKHPTKIFTSPNIFLPKQCARIWLEITDIKVEILQDISEEDAIAEGCENDKLELKFFDKMNPAENYKEVFKALWQSINGEESWDKNPFVWCISYIVLSKTGNPKK